MSARDIKDAKDSKPVKPASYYFDLRKPLQTLENFEPHVDKLYFRGDGHGNVMALLAFTHFLKILNCDDSSFTELNNIFSKPSDKVTEEDIKRFDAIMIKIIKQSTPKGILILLGDLLADRSNFDDKQRPRPNDTWTLFFIRALNLAEKLSNGQFTYQIIISNHDIELLLALQELTAEEFVGQKGKDSLNRSIITVEQTASAHNMRLFMQKGLITHAEIMRIIDEDYVTHLHVVTNFGPYLVSHAPSDLQSVANIAKFMEIKFDQKDIPSTINNINLEFRNRILKRQLRQLFPSDVSDMEDIPRNMFRFSLWDIIWRRQIYPLNRTGIINIHGHVGDRYGSSAEAINMDKGNELGKYGEPTGNMRVYVAIKPGKENNLQNTKESKQELKTEIIEQQLAVKGPTQGESLYRCLSINPDFDSPALLANAQLAEMFRELEDIVLSYTRALLEMFYKLLESLKIALENLQTFKDSCVTLFDKFQAGASACIDSKDSKETKLEYYCYSYPTLPDVRLKEHIIDAGKIKQTKTLTKEVLKTVCTQISEKFSAFCLTSDDKWEKVSFIKAFLGNRNKLFPSIQRNLDSKCATSMVLFYNKLRAINIHFHPKWACGYALLQINNIIDELRANKITLKDAYIQLILLFTGRDLLKNQELHTNAKFLGDFLCEFLFYSPNLDEKLLTKENLAQLKQTSLSKVEVFAQLQQILPSSLMKFGEKHNYIFHFDLMSLTRFIFYSLYQQKLRKIFLEEDKFSYLGSLRIIMFSSSNPEITKEDHNDGLMKFIEHELTELAISYAQHLEVITRPRVTATPSSTFSAASTAASTTTTTTTSASTAQQQPAPK